MNYDVEIFILEARIAGLKSRIKLQQDFIKRCQAKQKAGLGLVKPSPYKSLARNAKSQHRIKSKRRKKGEVWINYFTWDWSNISPHQIIKETEERIKMLELKLKELSDERA